MLFLMKDQIRLMNIIVKLSNEVQKLKEAKDKINILFIGANPTLNLNLEKEAREIREIIKYD